MGEPAPLSCTLIREELSRVLASRVFFRAGYLRKLLEVCVSETLRGNGGYLKEMWLAAEVFQRRGDFNPGLDPIVRVQARRLRDKLERFYRDEGSGDKIRITMPVGNYVPFFSTTAQGGLVRAFGNEKIAIVVGPHKPLNDCPAAIQVADRVKSELIEVLAEATSLQVGTRISLQADYLISGTVGVTSDGHHVRLEMTGDQSGQPCWSAWFEQGSPRQYANVRRIALLLREELCNRKTSADKKSEEDRFLSAGL